MLTVFPRPTDPFLNKTTVSLLYSIFIPRAKNLSPPLLPHHLHLQSVDPTNILFIAGTVAKMVPKPRPVEGEENPFLPPPVDLDKIPLFDKDRLIANTKCEFDKVVYLGKKLQGQIGLPESNLIALVQEHLLEP